MEVYNLQYLSPYEVILCRDHDYCLRRDGCEKHLRRSHAARGSSLKRAIMKIRDLSQLHKPEDIQNPTSGKAPISGLLIISGLQCVIDDCDFITSSTKNMQRHQSKLHELVEFKNTHQHTEDVTTRISYQSFFSKPFFRPFVVDNLYTSQQPLEKFSTTRSSMSTSRETTYSFNSHKDEVSLKNYYVRSQQK